jgi:hypothetical protein
MGTNTKETAEQIRDRHLQGLEQSRPGYCEDLLAKCRAELRDALAMDDSPQKWRIVASRVSAIEVLTPTVKRNAALIAAVYSGKTA